MMHHNFMYLDLIKAVLNVSIAFEKEYREKSISTVILKILKNMMGSTFLAVVSSHFYYQQIRAAKMMLEHDGVSTLVESLNGDYGKSESLGISNLNCVGLCCIARHRSNERGPKRLRVKSIQLLHRKYRGASDSHQSGNQVREELG